MSTGLVEDRKDVGQRSGLIRLEKRRCDRLRRGNLIPRQYWVVPTEVVTETSRTVDHTSDVRRQFTRGTVCESIARSTCRTPPKGACCRRRLSDLCFEDTCD